MVDRYYAAFDELPALAVETDLDELAEQFQRNGTGEDLIPIYDRRAVGSCEPVAFAFGIARARAIADLMSTNLADAV